MTNKQENLTTRLLIQNVEFNEDIWFFSLYSSNVSSESSHVRLCGVIWTKEFWM